MTSNNNEWMKEWAQEYNRTTGKEAEVMHRGSGWYELRHPDSISGPVRQKEIRKMTEVLKRRPDYAG